MQGVEHQGDVELLEVSRGMSGVRVTPNATLRRQAMEDARCSVICRRGGGRCDGCWVCQWLCRMAARQGKKSGDNTASGKECGGPLDSGMLEVREITGASASRQLPVSLVCVAQFEAQDRVRLCEASLSGTTASAHASQSLLPFKRQASRVVL
ncbi:hypothetical protein BC826DRAFT_1074797, partial [Russula brevipes]